LGQDVGGLETAEMILVVLLQHVLAQPLERDALGADALQDLRLVDRVRVLEADDRVEIGLCVGHRVFRLELRRRAHRRR
jgi:hypothetical protein